MIGLIPHVLSNLIVEHRDQHTLRHIYQNIDLEPNHQFAINQYYQDELWQSFLSETLKTLHISEQQAYTLFAESFIQHVTSMFPTWFTMADNSFEFLQLQPKIHNSFASGLIDPTLRQQCTDKFQIEIHDRHVITHYKSTNQLCQLYICLAHRLAEHYGDQITIEEAQCQKHGDEECEIHVRWQ